MGTALNRSGMGAGQVGASVSGIARFAMGFVLRHPPQAFDRINSGAQGGKEDAAHMRMGGQEIAHDNGAVGLQIVPDHHERRTELAIQLLGERRGAPRC